MYAIIGDNAEAVRAADRRLEAAAILPRSALEQAAALRANGIVVVGTVAWTVKDANTLWETDSFVVLCGKLPPQPQYFAGIRHDGKSRVTVGGQLRCVHPDLMGGFAASARVPALPNTWAVETPGADPLVVLEGSDGRTYPLLARRGRVAYMAAAPDQLPEAARTLLFDALFAWLSAERQRFGLGPQSTHNIHPSFPAIQACIPATEKGPNARDYDYLLRRVTRLLGVLQTYTPHTDLHGKSVLDIGCGFGTTTVVSKAITGFGSIQGIDIDQRLMDIGNNIARNLDLDMRFQVGDMLKLEQFAGQFDIVICNNAFNYFRSAEEFRRVLHQFHLVLKPGGSFITLTPSRMGAIEAFTKFPGMQFLPRTVANDLIAQGNLSMIDYSIIKLPSPFETHWWMRQTGFEQIHLVDAYTLKEADVASLFKPRFYAVGTKPL